MVELRCLSQSGNIPEHRGNAPEAARKSIRSLLPHARAIVLCCTICTTRIITRYSNARTRMRLHRSHVVASCHVPVSSPLSNQHPPILISNPSPQSLQPLNFAILHSWLHGREHPLGDIITTSCFTSRVWGHGVMGFSLDTTMPSSVHMSIEPVSLERYEVEKHHTGSPVH